MAARYWPLTGPANHDTRPHVYPTYPSTPWGIPHLPKYSGGPPTHYDHNLLLLRLLSRCARTRLRSSSSQRKTSRTSRWTEIEPGECRDGLRSRIYPPTHTHTHARARAHARTHPYPTSAAWRGALLSAGHCPAAPPGVRLQHFHPLFVVSTVSHRERVLCCVQRRFCVCAFYR